MGDGLTGGVIHKCPHCGKITNTAAGLRHHITCVHVRPKKENAQRKGGAEESPAKKRRGRRAAAPSDTSDNYAALFEVATAQMDKQAELVNQCITGLRTFLEHAKKLRLAYMKQKKEIAQLRSLAEEAFEND